MKCIKSLSNPLIKSTAGLLSTSGRKKSGCFIIEGAKLCLEALDSGFTAEHCFIVEGFDNQDILKRIESCRIVQVTPEAMQKMSGLTTAQDVMMTAKIPASHILDDKSDIIIALDRIADPHNIGAILRSAEAFGINQVVLSSGCADMYSPKVLRGAMGSVFRIGACYVDLISYLKDRKSNGYKILGAGLSKKYLTVNKLENFKKAVIIIGNEGGGISKAVMEICDNGLYIPMLGKNESLNAAVAASVIMWEWQRQRVRL